MNKHSLDIGAMYGSWTVVSTVKPHPRKVLCRCSCGIELPVDTSALICGKTKSCVACYKKRRNNALPRDTPMDVGATYGSWTVVSTVRPHPRKVLCRCSCGTEAPVNTTALIHGKTKSCLNCYKKKRNNARASDTPEYGAWGGMLNRCYNQNAPNYADWGGRGITVVDEWRGEGGFKNFLAHMGLRPHPKMSVHRTDNDGPYAPGNVVWATGTEQARNRRNTRWLEFEGQRKPIAEWGELTGVSAKLITRRIDTGLPVEEALCPTIFSRKNLRSLVRHLCTLEVLLRANNIPVPVMQVLPRSVTGVPTARRNSVTP